MFSMAGGVYGHSEASVNPSVNSVHFARLRPCSFVNTWRRARNQALTSVWHPPQARVPRCSDRRGPSQPHWRRGAVHIVMYLTSSMQTGKAPASYSARSDCAAWAAAKNLARPCRPSQRVHHADHASQDPTNRRTAHTTTSARGTVRPTQNCVEAAVRWRMTCGFAGVMIVVGEPILAYRLRPGTCVHCGLETMMPPRGTLRCVPGRT